MRPLAPTVALLVVLAAVAVPALAVAPSGAPSAVAAPTSAQVETPDTAGEIAVLAVPPGETTRSSLERESVELGSGLAFASTTAELRLATGATLERIESADSADRRQQRLLRAVEGIERRVDALHTRQREAIRAYARGDSTQRRFLYELAAIDAEARELDDRRERLQSTAEATAGVSVPSSRFGSVELELNTLTGPVRGHAAAVLKGEADSARFFVQTGPDSVVLGVIRDGTYVREVYRGSLRGGDSGEFTLADAVNATERAYPTAAAQRLRDDTLGSPGSDTARVTIEHRRGRLVAFVDGGSRQVFKEFQFRPIDRVATGSPTSASRDGLELTAHPTYPGGPVRLQLNGTADDEPVDAQITVGPPDGRSSVVGRTGDDGSLWALAPTGGYQVTAIDGSSVVVLSVDPGETPSVYGARNGTDGGTATATPTG